jgi:hypothetical protein
MGGGVEAAEATGVTGAAPAVVAYRGGAISGKTESLMREAAEALGSGAGAGELLFVSASRNAARELATRARGELGVAVRCRSALQLAFATLETPEARALFGHGTRTLLDVERSLLVADLRHAGADAGELARAYRGLERAWARGELPSTEPGGAGEAIAEGLEERGAYDARELVARARACLARTPGLASRVGAAVVLVDDANALSRGALLMARDLAGRRLVLAGDDQVENCHFDPGADRHAFVELAREAGGEPRALAVGAPAVGADEAYSVKSLSGADEARMAAEFVDRALKDPPARRDPAGPAAGGGQPAPVVPGEATSAAARVGGGRTWPDGPDGADDPDYPECPGGSGDAKGAEGADGLDAPELYHDEVFVIVPGAPWARVVDDALDRGRIPHEEQLDRQQIGGDPRHVATVGALQSFALLCLVADGGDVAAWRTWMALGRPDVSCAAWQGLRAFAQARGAGVVEALGALADEAGARGADEPFPGASLLARRYSQAQDLIRRNSRRAGLALIEAVSPDGDAAFERLCEPILAQRAPELARRVNRRVVDRGFSASRERVRVGVVEAFLGLPHRVVCDMGLNQGVAGRLAPRAADGGARASEEAQRLALASHLGACARTRDRLVLSYVQRCPLSQARALGARVTRTRAARDGSEPLAVLAPCALFDLLGAQVPPTTSSQQFLECVLDVRA